MFWLLCFTVKISSFNTITIGAIQTLFRCEKASDWKILQIEGKPQTKHLNKFLQPMIKAIFKTARVAKKIWRIINTIASIWGENMLGYLSLDIICSSQLTVFLELRFRKPVRYSEQIMSVDKYPSIFSRQSETIVYISTTNHLPTVWVLLWHT